MYELLLYDSYLEWVVPLTVALIWIWSLKVVYIVHPVDAKTKTDKHGQAVIFHRILLHHDVSMTMILQLIMTVRRKENPDDPEALHLSYLSIK